MLVPLLFAWWFSVAAKRAGKSRWLWATVGALVALVVGRYASMAIGLVVWQGRTVQLDETPPGLVVVTIGTVLTCLGVGALIVPRKPRQ